MRSDDTPAEDSECLVSLSQLRDILASSRIKITSLAYVKHGWDSNVYRLNDSKILRVPRKISVVTRFRDELRILKLIRDNSWVKIPNYQIILDGGKKVELIAAYPMLKGDAALDLADVKDGFPALAKFLSFLHRIHEAQEIVLTNKTNLWQYKEEAKESLEKIRHKLTSRERNYLEKALSKNVADSDQKVVIHNDLRPDHILILSDKISIIDWTDVAWANPWEEFLWLWIYWGDDIFPKLKNHYDGWRDEWVDHIQTVGTWKIVREYQYGVGKFDSAKLQIAKQALSRLISM